MGYPSTYIHRKLNAIGHVQTIVPVGADGDLDLNFQGVQMTMVPFGPPQSALPTIISMSPEQHQRLGKLTFMPGDHQEMCRRVYEKTRTKDGGVQALVLSTDWVLIKDALKRGDKGQWQDFFREIVEAANGG